jgi:uncharacterized membrane protein YbjE (DUF340 family)
MTWIVFGAVAMGIIAGRFILPMSWFGSLDTVASFALAALVFGVGIDIGRNRNAWLGLRKLGLRIVWIPVCIAMGSIAGAVIAGYALGMPFNESGAVGAGFGWYSLSGIIITQVYNVETGALAFLANVIREILALMSIPFLARYVGKLTAIAPGGATTMDTTLPMILRFSGSEIALIAFFSGVVLTLAVPILVPIIIGL